MRRQNPPGGAVAASAKPLSKVMIELHGGRPARRVFSPRNARAGAWSLWAASLIVALALALELGFEGRDPFWLDESWTGAIIARPSWRAVGQQIYWDVNAPLYYLLVKLWSLVFGLSDVALRAPSVIFAALTPLAAALIPSTLSRIQRLGWAALLAFWFPTLCYAEEARCYALLLLICTLQTLAYLQLMQAPSTGRAAIWAGLAATAILTHYDALYLGAVQGLLYVARAPRRAVASWPAALAFVPVFGWMAYHWPTIAKFAQPNVAWYSPLRVGDLPLIGRYLADGGSVMPLWLGGLALCALSLRLLPLPPWGEDGEDARPLWWAVGAAALSTAALVAIGFLRPSFTFRYLTPDAPGLLLGLVGLARVLAGRRGAALSVATLAAVYLGVSGWMLDDRLRMAPRRYNFERASQLLATTHPSRLVFLWDHPIDPVLHPEQLSALGGFFLQRMGLDILVDPVVLKPGEDPNTRLLNDAAPSGSAILWLYDRNVHGTAAIAYPPRITRQDAAWRCWRSSSARFGVVACARQPDAGSAAHQPGAPQPHGAP